MTTNTHILCLVDTCRRWGKTDWVFFGPGCSNFFDFGIFIKLLLSLSQVWLLSLPQVGNTSTSLVHCSVPFGSSFLLSLYLIAMDGILCSSSVVSVESCLLPSIWIKPCQVFNTSIVTPPWVLVYKGAHTLTLHKTSSSRLSVSRNAPGLH